MQRPNTTSGTPTARCPISSKIWPRSSSSEVCPMWHVMDAHAFRSPSTLVVCIVRVVSTCLYHADLMPVVVFLIFFWSRTVRMDRVHLVRVHRLGIPRGLRPEVQCGRLQAVPVPPGARLAPVRAPAGARRGLRQPHRLLQGDGRRRVRAGVDRGDGLARLQRLYRPHHQTRCPEPTVKIPRLFCSPDPGIGSCRVDGQDPMPGP